LDFSDEEDPFDRVP